MSQSRSGTVDRLKGMGTLEESQLTVDVNRFEGGAGVSTTMRGRGSAVLGLFLSNVGGPVLLYHRADGDVKYRAFDVLLDEGTERWVIVAGRVDAGLVLVGFAVQGDLWARYTRKDECTKRKEEKKHGFRTSENRNFKQQPKGAPKKTLLGYSPARVPVSVTNRVNPVLNRISREIVGRIRPRQHCSLNTATSIVAHDDDMTDA